jgi:alpha-L-rhamnosidase
VAEETSVEPVRFEHHRAALGIGEDEPRLSWRVRTRAPGWQQASYEVRASGAVTGNVSVHSGESVLAPWPFAPLRSRERVAVQVRVTGTDGSRSPWSPPATAETGLLHADDWTARFISAGWDEDPQQDQPAVELRREFVMRSGAESARLYTSALGVYEASLNGTVVGDLVLAPGWTAYASRLRYQTYDVTGLIREGSNTLAAVLGDGWYRGRIGYDGKARAVYGDRLAWLAQLEVRYADGTVQTVATDADGRWGSATGPIRTSSIYDGETYDARMRPEDWRPVRVEPREPTTLTAPTSPPVRRIEEVAPVAISTSPSGKTLVDFGQNLVGRIRFTVQGEAGREITLRHAEILQDGELATGPLRTARATDRYILRGGEPETYEPRFTFHGFRYAEVTGWPGDLRPDALRAIVIHSDLERTGYFTCSDELVNRLHENVVWGMRGNFLDVPTDCPQRDERLGWTGDIQVFSPTAAFLYDTAGFLGSWLRDLAADQAPDGTIPFVVPKCTPTASVPAAAWGDAGTIVPWVIYQRHGDTGVLAAQFDSMRAWVDRLDGLAGPRRLWDTGFQFGDWLDPTAPRDRPERAATPGEIVATAYFARSADIVAQVAGLLGLGEEATRYAELAARVRTAFQAEYVTGSGRLMADAPTAYALALQFALLPGAAQREHAGRRLADLVKGRGYTIPTGFVGTPLLCDALAETGHLEAAYRLLLQRECPSWLYQVTHGATTIWERWDSLLPDGTVNPSGMTSFNHYAFGAVADWLHRTVAGLAPAAPGYRRIRFAPRPGGGLTHAQASLLTPYGLTAISWQLDGADLRVTATVPPNAAAEVDLPGQPLAQVGAGRHKWHVTLPSVRSSREPVTLASTIGDLMDSPEAFRLFKEALVRHVPEAAAYLDQPDGAAAGLTVRDALALVPGADQLLSELDRSFAELGS